MAPVLQTFVRVALCVLLGLLFLSEMSFVVSCDLSHVGNVVLVVFGWILFGVLFEDCDDFPPAVRKVSL